MNRKLSFFLTGLTATALAGAILSTTSCSKNDDGEGPKEVTSDTLSGSITTDVTLKTGKTYYLSGATFIKSNATLKIEPGVVIKAIKGTKAVLVITRGSKIDAQGTSSQPIVFTSNQEAGARATGDWGGVVLLGKANVNTSTTVDGAGTRLVEGFDNAEAAAYGADIIGGGKTSPDDADNSGWMKFVRIEFPGIALSSTTNSELNGLTFVAVGSGTTIDHVQVSFSGDDSFEWFGGTVNCTHLIAYRGLDDDFDTDNGYRGKVQFAFSVRDNAIHDADANSTNGFESDNEDPVPATLHTPLTAAVFSNVTLIGPGTFTGGTVDAAFGRAALIRRGSRLSIFNSVMTGWKNGINLADDFTNNSATAGDLELKNNYLVGFSSGKVIYSSYASGQTGTTNVGANILTNASNSNDSTLTVATSLNLANLTLGSSIDVRPGSSSPLLGDASFTSTKLSGLTTVTYVGAFSGTGDTWANTWTEFDPKSKTY